MSRKILWLRVSYWAGAIADALIGILALIPSRMGETEFRYPMGIAASVMFGWACLLVWADRSPAERRGILLITVFPTIIGLLLAGVYAVISDLFPVSKMVPSSILATGLVVLMLFSYFNAGDQPSGRLASPSN